MKIVLYPKSQIEAAWKKDKRLYTNGFAANPPRCLRCGNILSNQLALNATSRYADIQVCEACGMDEAMRDWRKAPLPFQEWDAVKEKRIALDEKKGVIYLKYTCSFMKIFLAPACQKLTDANEIVHSRSDYDGFRWWTTWHNQNGKKLTSEQMQEIDRFQDALLQLPVFETLDTMKHFSRYAQPTSLPSEFNLYAETGNLYIWLRLITRVGDYNLYVHFYDKHER